MEVVWSPTAVDTQSTNAQRKTRSAGTDREAGQRADMTGGQGHVVTTER